MLAGFGELDDAFGGQGDDRILIARKFQRSARHLPIIREMQRASAASLSAIAEALNARGIATARGGRWQAMTVSHALSRV